MTASIDIRTGDAVDVLTGLDAGSVDLVLTDYAYESLEKHRNHGTTTRLAESTASSNAWFQTFPNRRIPSLLRACYRALKPGRHAYFLCDDETSDVIKREGQLAGFYLWNTLVWIKTPARTPPGQAAAPKIGMGYHYRRCTERIVFFEKMTRSNSTQSDDLFNGAAPTRPPAKGDGRQLNDRGMPEVLFCPGVVGGYPTQKPVWLLRQLIEQSTQPDELVVDPFAGSGSTGAAALECGRRAILGDLSAAAVAGMHARFGLEPQKQ